MIQEPLQAHLVRMARYHHWAHVRLVEALEPLDAGAFKAPAGLFFGSIHGTLNHLLVAERLWRGRLVGEPVAFGGLDEELFADRGALQDALVQESCWWEGYVAGLDQGQLAGRFGYTNTRGEAMQAERAPILGHVFNHATHHRGQVTAVMTRLGLQAPALDLLYFIVPGA